MNRHAIKICGVRESQHAHTAALCGADYIGMIFADGKRQVTIQQAQAIVAAVDSFPTVQMVGVFVNQSAASMHQTAQQVGLDILQLSGDEPIAIFESLRLPVFKAIRMQDTPQENAWLNLALRFPEQVTLVIDAHVPGVYGGAGVVSNWQQAAHYAQTYSVFLAGGLNPDNVGQAIHAVKPVGVDVSSGTETAGIKDHDKIKAFIHHARTTWASELDPKTE